MLRNLILRIAIVIVSTCVCFEAVLRPAIADEKLALVIGNIEYENLQDLPLAESNASQISSALAGVGFSSTGAPGQVSPKLNLSLAQLSDELLRFSENLAAQPEGSTGFIYFAGHGIAQQRRGDVYLLPSDAILKAGTNLDNVGIAMADLVQLMRAQTGRTVVIVVDACRNVAPSLKVAGVPSQSETAATTAQTRGVELVGNGWGEESGRVGLLQRGFQRDTSQKTNEMSDYFVAFSTSPDKVAYDSDIFSSILADEINQSRHDIFSLFKAVSERVASETKISGNLQLPTYEVGLYGEPPCFGSCRGQSQSRDVFYDCPGCPWIKSLAAAQFQQGSPLEEKGRDKSEPIATLANVEAFSIGIYEVTRAEWGVCQKAGACRDLLRKNKWQTPKTPIAGVTLEDATDYVNWLNSISDAHYRLPTEAEWEYAARAGSTTAFSTGTTIAPHQAAYDYSASYEGSRRAEYRGAPESVGSFNPNAFELFDMHGNVWEWTCKSFENGVCNSPVLRGGSYKSTPVNLRASNRYEIKPTKSREDVGFRVVRTS